MSRSSPSPLFRGPHPAAPHCSRALTRLQRAAREGEHVKGSPEHPSPERPLDALSPAQTAAPHGTHSSQLWRHGPRPPTPSTPASYVALRSMRPPPCPPSSWSIQHTPPPALPFQSGAFPGAVASRTARTAATALLTGYYTRPDAPHQRRLLLQDSQSHRRTALIVPPQHALSPTLDLGAAINTGITTRPRATTAPTPGPTTPTDYVRPDPNSVPVLGAESAGGVPRGPASPLGSPMTPERASQFVWAPILSLPPCGTAPPHSLLLALGEVPIVYPPLVR